MSIKCSSMLSVQQNYCRRWDELNTFYDTLVYTVFWWCRKQKRIVQSLHRQLRVVSLHSQRRFLLMNLTS